MNSRVKLILIIIWSLIFGSTAYAENWICHDENNQITVTAQGDCKVLGICSGDNNSGVNPSCFEATAQEFDKAQQNLVEVDMGVVVGSRVVDYSAEKIAQIEDAKSAAEIDYNKKINDLKNKLKGLGLTDEEVSIILDR